MGSNKDWEQEWGKKVRQLRVETAIFNNFRTKPVQDRNNAKTSQYLDRYALVLRQANAIILSGMNSNDQSNTSSGQSTASNGQSNGSNGQGNNTGWGSPQQQLSMYLHMMRQLRLKIMGMSGSQTTTQNGGQDSTSTHHTP